AGVLLGEGFPRRLLLGMAAAFAGVAIIAAATSSGERDALGVALGLAAAALYAGAATSQKRLLARVDALTMTWVGCLAGTVALVPFAPTLAAQGASAPASSTWAVVLLGLGPTALALTTWGYALTRLTSGRSAPCWRGPCPARPPPRWCARAARRASPGSPSRPCRADARSLPRTARIESPDHPELGVAAPAAVTRPAPAPAARRSRDVVT